MVLCIGKQIIKKISRLGGVTYGLVLVADNNWCFDCRWGTQNGNYEEVQSKEKFK